MGRGANLKDLRERVREAGGATAPEGMRRRLAQATFEDRVQQVKAKFPKPPPGSGPLDPMHFVSLGRALREAAPAAYDAVAADVTTAAANGREGLLKFCEQNAIERPPIRQRLLWEFLADLEKRRPALTDDLLVRTDDLEASILRTLRVPDEKIAEFRKLQLPAERLDRLRALLREHGPLGRPK